MQKLRETTLNSFHYLFLQYSTGHPLLIGNEMIETELEQYLIALEHELRSKSQYSRIAVAVIRELSEGDYFEKQSADLLKKSIDDAIFLLLNFRSGELLRFYSTCIDYAANKVKQKAIACE
jgi:isocitrate/isopropylmalate dehydrogenase